MGQRDPRVDAFAELTKHIHPDWRVRDVRLHLAGPGLPTAELVVQDKEDKNKRLTDRYRWDGHAWCLIQSS